jgi:two-component system response regulator FixJ
MAWVHIVDDDPQVLDSVAFLLETHGISTTRHDCAAAFLRSLPQLKPGCILLDIEMPGMCGLDLQRQLNAIGCPMPVVFITGHGDVSSAVCAMKEGAIDFIQKPFDKRDLIAAIEAATQTFQRKQNTCDIQRKARDTLARLSRREREVIDALASGHANKVIAYDLGISTRTVEFYRANAMRKLELRTLPEVVQLVMAAAEPAAEAGAGVFALNEGRQVPASMQLAR